MKKDAGCRMLDALELELFALHKYEMRVIKFIIEDSNCNFPPKDNCLMFPSPWIVNSPRALFLLQRSFEDKEHSLNLYLYSICTPYLHYHITITQCHPQTNHHVVVIRFQPIKLRYWSRLCFVKAKLSSTRASHPSWLHQPQLQKPSTLSDR